MSTGVDLTRRGLARVFFPLLGMGRERGACYLPDEACEPFVTVKAGLVCVGGEKRLV